MMPSTAAPITVAYNLDGPVVYLLKRVTGRGKADEQTIFD